MRFVIYIWVVMWLVACGCSDDVVRLPEQTQRAAGLNPRVLQDPAFAKAFSKSPFLNQEQFSLNWYPNTLEIKTYLGLYIPESNDTIAAYKKLGHAPSDAISRRFIRVAKNRGDVVKAYNAQANQAIVGCVKSASRGEARADMDSTLVAYDKEGRMTAVLVRVHEFEDHMVTKNHYIVSKIYVGSILDNIERQISRRQLNGQLLKVI